MIRLFAGFDPREEVGYHTFCSSVIHGTHAPVAIAPVTGLQWDGTNAFTYARFQVPKLCHYQGWAIFADGSDMVVRGDIYELWKLCDDRFAVQVVKHHYNTQHPRKYVGTPMEADNDDYPCKNWSSVMLMNCSAPEWRDMLPNQHGGYYHRFEFIDPRRVGKLPRKWNWLADEFGENDDAELLHWTAGIPAFHHYRDSPMACEWFGANERANRC